MCIQYTLPTKVHIIKVMVFPVVMYGCESWTIRKHQIWIVVLEKTLESPLDNKEIKPVNPKGNQPWIFIGRTGTETEAPILWLSDEKSQLTGKDPEAGKDWGQEEKGVTEDKWLDGITDWMDMNLSKLWKIVKDRGAWPAAVPRVSKSQTWLSN